MNFINLEPVYASSALDIAGYYVSLEIDGQKLKVIEYDHGLADDPRKPDYPEGLFQLEEIVKEIAGMGAK